MAQLLDVSPAEGRSFEMASASQMLDIGAVSFEVPRE